MAKNDFQYGVFIRGVSRNALYKCTILTYLLYLLLYDQSVSTISVATNNDINLHVVSNAPLIYSPVIYSLSLPKRCENCQTVPKLLLLNWLSHGRNYLTSYNC